MSVGGSHDISTAHYLLLLSCCCFISSFSLDLASVLPLHRSQPYLASKPEILVQFDACAVSVYQAGNLNVKGRRHS